ncbi:MAG: NAD(P)/FAD-dependent oxidoreductase [Caulobacteraceae bacterium]|nr:NAD(P)/FAD-dependent oxidoreductase [Caulobacteraceae bacterium]
MEHLDVLVVGAGISGISAAYHLQRRLPSKSFAIFEARPRLGGTWDLFRFPGVRSDSDMHSLAFSFRPWKRTQSIVAGADILAYLRETAAAFGIDCRIRFGRQVTGAAWDSAAARWTVTYREGADGAQRQLTCGFLFFCAGYYSYAGGHRPAFPEESRFRGPIIHPQDWPQDLDLAGKEVVVIGSGATAITLVPALAKEARHVVMLQRSPTYVVSRPSEDALARRLAKFLPATIAHRLARWRNVLLQMWFFRLARRRPSAVRAQILRMIRDQLGPDYDVATHFSPTYKPWDQRLCLIPEADLFEAIRAGGASVVTGRIETFTETGVTLASGETLAADVIVTATGLEVELLGGATLEVDGARVELGRTFSYKGLMFSGVPNLAAVFGYTNASWTLKADLAAQFVCRLLAHMDRRGWAECRPVGGDLGRAGAPWLDFSSGYIVRALDRLPKQGDRPPWKVRQNYLADLLALRFARIEDGVLRFSAPGRAPIRTKA